MDSKKDKKASPRDVPLGVRLIVAVVFVIFGVIFANTAFFRANPLFGINFLAEILISIVTALFGFFTLPRLFVQGKHWFETLVIKTVSDIVVNFWDQQTKRMQSSRRQRQQKKKARQRKDLKTQLSDGFLLDTSVLVDGRILDIVKTGFLSASLIVPEFVLDELHLISDNEDSLKRQRGRRGLDILKDLKKHVKVIIPNIKTKTAAVDKSLVETAKKYKLKLMTLDFNLNKVAAASGISVLNINDLANAVKPAVLPGESFDIKIIQVGKEKAQGVGYLSNGTMIVVEGAHKLVGKTVSVEVSKVIQGSAGKMVFAKVL